MAIEVSFDDFDDGEVDIQVVKTFKSKDDRIKFFSKFSQPFSKRIDRLDEFQRKVVLAPISESMEIRAAAGSGKTTTVITRALDLMITHGVHPNKICLTAFNNKAAKDISGRFAEFLDDISIPTPHVSTLHRLGMRIYHQDLGNQRNSIISQYHMYKYALSILEKYQEKPDKELVGAYLISMDNIYNEGLVSTLVKPVLTESKLGIKEYKKPDLDSSNHLIESSMYSKPYMNLDMSHKWKKKEYAEYIYDKLDECMNPAYAASEKANLSIDPMDLMRIMITEKLNNQHLSYNDMIWLAAQTMAISEEARKVTTHLFEHIIIDEAQDLDCIQLCMAINLDKDTSDLYTKQFKEFKESLK